VSRERGTYPYPKKTHPWRAKIGGKKRCARAEKGSEAACLTIRREIYSFFQKKRAEKKRKELTLI